MQLLEKRNCIKTAYVHVLIMTEEKYLRDYSDCQQYGWQHLRWIVYTRVVKLVRKCHTNMARLLISTTKRALELLCKELNVAVVGRTPSLEDYILQKVKVKSSRPHTCTGVRQSLASCNCTNLQPTHHTPKRSDLSFKQPLTFGYSHTGLCAIRTLAAKLCVKGGDGTT